MLLAFESRSSFADPATGDRTIDLLNSTLVAFSRLAEVLRFAEVVSWIEEVLVYLEAAFNWTPILVLDAAISLLRALFGTNISSIWNSELSSKFHAFFDFEVSAFSESESLDEQIKQVCETHFENAVRIRSHSAIGRSFLDWLHSARRSHQPAMLQPKSLPAHIQQPKLAYYIRLFEPLVLQCIHRYHLYTETAVQAKILQILTVLIELGVNYAQLDEESRFLKSLISQCESLQHNNATASYDHQTSAEHGAELVANMFKFFVVLTYERKSNVSFSSETKTVLTLSEVVHLAEMLAAGGLDMESFVVPALAPLIIDIYVHRGARYHSALRINALNSQEKDLHDWTAHREALLRFLLPKFIGHPKAFDFFSIALEDAALTDTILKVPFEAGDSSLAYRTATEICRHFLKSLANCSLVLDSCGDVDACLRLIRRLSSPQWPPSTLNDVVLRQIICILYNDCTEELFFKQSVQRWMACKLVCLRFLLLLAVKQPSALLPVLRDFGDCGKSDPRAVFFEHLLDHIAIIVDALLNHLQSSLVDAFVNSTGKKSNTFLEQLLLSFQLDVLTLSRLHAFSFSGVPLEKIERLNCLLSTYSRFKPLVMILWHQIRCEVFQTSVENDQVTPYHRNSVCVHRVLFLFHVRNKRDGFTTISDEMDLLTYLKPSQLSRTIVPIGDTNKRLEFIETILSATTSRFITAVVPTEALSRVKILRVMVQIISDCTDQGWEIENSKVLLFNLMESIKVWYDIKSKNSLFELPSVRRELEFLLTDCLQSVDNLKLDELPEHLKFFLESLDPTRASRNFFTSALPKILIKMLNRFSRIAFKEEPQNYPAKNLIETTLDGALNAFAQDSGRLAARLIQSNPQFQLPNELPPRFLQHVFRQAFVATMKRFNSDVSGTFETNPLWQWGSKMLFQMLDRLTQIKDDIDLTSQRQLTGLAAATLDFLILSARLPLPSNSTAEAIEAMSTLLQKLMQIFIGIANEEMAIPHPSIFDLPSLTLRLAIVLISSTGGKILDSPKLPLETFIQFAEALDVFASLSRPNTLVSCRSSNRGSVHPDEQIVHRLRDLLVPKQPGIFHGNASTATTAYTLIRFTEVLNSFAANSAATGGSGDRNERSRVALASVFGLCRLCPAGGTYINALSLNSSDLSTQFSAFLISLCRRYDVLLQLSRPSAFSDAICASCVCDTDRDGSLSTSSLLWNPDRVVEMDRDALAEASTWLLSLGWLDKTIFESTWTALLAVCTPPQSPSPSRASSLYEEDFPFLYSKEEQVEENHCRVLGLNVLTRLLLNAAHRPKSGDPLHNSSFHQPRLSMPPRFMHTRLGGRINHVLGRLDQEIQSFFHDIPQTSTVIGFDAGCSEGCLSWLSTNLDLEYLADLDSPANQVPIECLVKWMLHSPTEPAGFEADTIVSCLQSLRLVHHSWLRPFEERILSRVTEPVNNSNLILNTSNQKSLSTGSKVTAITSPQVLQRMKFVNFLKRGSKSLSSGQGDSKNQMPFAFGDSILLTGVLLPSEKTDVLQTESSEAKLEHFDGSSEITPPANGSQSRQVFPSLAVLTSVVRSAVLCSDLFTTREQFLWLIGCLQAVYQSLPRIEEENFGFSTAPIYTWLTMGLARCTAVLEATMLPVSTDIDIPSAVLSENPNAEVDLSSVSTTFAPQQHHSAPILLANNLQAAVSAVAGAIFGPNSSVALQDAGLRGAMDLFQAALLLKATRHPALQQPVLANNPPTGSALLNMLLHQICLYLDSQLENLFESEIVLLKKWRTAKASSTNLLRIGSGNAGSGISKITAGFARAPSVSTGSPNSSARSASFGLNRSAGGTFKARSPSDWAAERISSHQSTVLATSFFIVEQFSPLVDSDSTAIGRMIVQLTNQLLRLTEPMLHEVQRDFTPPARLAEVFRTRFAETQATLVCADSVVSSWIRGMQRLLLSRTLRRDACEMLVKQAVNRLVSTNSNRLRLSSLSLLMTALYTLNAAEFLTRVSPDHRSDDSGNLLDPDSLLSSSTEYLTALWQCLRGGSFPIVPSSNVRFGHSHIIPFEARCIALSLGSILEDLGKCLLGTVLTNPTPLGSLVNKAVAEVARLSGGQDGYLRLASVVLRDLVMTLTKVSKKGEEVVQEWILLALPSLLQQCEQEMQIGAPLWCHGYWVAALCILLANRNSIINNSVLNICLSSLPSIDCCQQREVKRCQYLLLAACSLVPSGNSPDDFRRRVLEIVQKAGGLADVHKALVGCATTERT